MKTSMSANNQIYWLASYPKSGNTWFRTFLCNLMKDDDKPVSINELPTGSIGSSRGWLDDGLGFDSADLYQNEINRLRPDIYEWSVGQIKEPGYHKIHDACWQLDSGRWLISEKASSGALYFVRNPLDVAISYANHCNSSIDKAISRMSNPEHCLSKNKHRRLNIQAEQRLLTWSQHVLSWVDNPVIDVHVMRYEDMKHQPEHTFSVAVNFLQFRYSTDKITKALKFSDFKLIQQQEIDDKFRERPPHSPRFFRKGIAGDWLDTLTTAQVDQIIESHHEVMHRFGYLDNAGNPQVM